MYKFFCLFLFKIFFFERLMKIQTCIVCGKKLFRGEEEICKTCFEWMKSKHKLKKLKQRLKWHKKQNQKLTKEN